MAPMATRFELDAAAWGLDPPGGQPNRGASPARGYCRATDLGPAGRHRPGRAGARPASCSSLLPFWSLLIIALDILVIWALVMQPGVRRRRGPDRGAAGRMMRRLGRSAAADASRTTRRPQPSIEARRAGAAPASTARSSPRRCSPPGCPLRGAVELGVMMVVTLLVYEPPAMPNCSAGAPMPGAARQGRRMPTSLARYLADGRASYLAAGAGGGTRVLGMNRQGLLPPWRWWICPSHCCWSRGWMAGRASRLRLTCDCHIDVGRGRVRGRDDPRAAASH